MLGHTTPCFLSSLQIGSSTHIPNPVNGFDPFAGRASSVFAGAAHGRPSIGIEINPVGWIYGKTKITPASKEKIRARLVEVTKIAKSLPSLAGHNCQHCLIIALRKQLCASCLQREII